MSDAADNTFSAGETKLLISIIKNLSGDLQSDWDAVAVDMGYKDGTIARTRWNQTRRKKITGPAAGNTSTAKTTKATPKKPAAVTKKGTAAKAKAKARKTADSDDEDEDDEEKVIAVTVKEEEEDDDDNDDDEEDATTKTPAKSKAAAGNKVAAKPRGINKRKASAAAAASASTSDIEDDEKNVKKLKRIGKVNKHARIESDTQDNPNMALGFPTEQNSGSGEDAVMGATQEDNEEEEIIKKENEEESELSEI